MVGGAAIGAATGSVEGAVAGANEMANSRGQPIVDFGKPIGVDAATGISTQYGTIHSGENGAHIVPANPTTIGN